MVPSNPDFIGNMIEVFKVLTVNMIQPYLVLGVHRIQRDRRDGC